MPVGGWHGDCAMPVVERLIPSLIQRAAEMFGGMVCLAQHLQVPEHSLYLWSAGKARAPIRVVEVLVDLVLQDDIARASEDRRQEPRGSVIGIHRPSETARPQ